MEFLGRFAKNVLSFPAMSKYGDADPLAQPLKYLEESLVSKYSFIIRFAFLISEDGVFCDCL